MEKEKLIFVLTGSYLYAECYTTNDGKLIVDVKHDLDESIIESIPVESRHQALTVAFNATVGKE